MSGRLRLLTYTSLYPSAARPRHGVFVEARLLRLLSRSRGAATASVIAPVVWFPFPGERWGEYGRIAGTPRQERRSGVDVCYPRYLRLPRLDFPSQPAAMARAGLREVERLQRAGKDFDLVDAHYLYPDGVAAAGIARAIGRPFVLSARGSDVNIVAQIPKFRARILEAIEGSAGVIAVSSALRTSLVNLGVPEGRVTVLRNGVDAALFRVVDQKAARAELGLPPDGSPVLASVGNLLPGKRHHLAVEAAALTEGSHVVVVGYGPERAKLERLAHERGLSGRAHFFEEMTQERLRLVYSAADVLVLASEREGWPNVVLEAAACGTPVVAFPVGGVPEILVDADIGTIVREEQTGASLAVAIRALLARPRSRAQVRAAAVRFAWEPVLDSQLAFYQRAAGHRGSFGPTAVTEAVA